MSGWWNFWLVAFAWITWGAAGAYLSQQKGRGPFEGFILAVLLGPIGLVIEIWQKPKPSKGRRVERCPVCNTKQNASRSRQPGRTARSARRE